MDFPFFNKNDTKLALVFDIGSSSIGGAFFELEKDGPPKIIYSLRESIDYQIDITASTFLSSTLKTLNILAKNMSTSGFGRPDKIFCMISASWYTSEIRTIKIEKNTPFIFTNKFANDLIQKEMEIFGAENRNSNLTVRDLERPMEFKNMKVILNGYPTIDPFDKKTKKVEMRVFISLGSEKVLSRIEEIIDKHFSSLQVKFFSFSISAFSVTRDLYPNIESFILVDIAGELTDISMIKKNSIESSVSFPIGRNFFIRELAKNLGSSLSEAWSMFSIYKDGHAAKSLEKKISPILDKITKDWLNNFQTSLVNVSEDISVPSDIFIAVDQDIADFFGRIIKNEEFNQYTLTDSKFKIIFLDLETLHGLVSFKENIPRDPFLLIASLYISRFIW